MAKLTVPNIMHLLLPRPSNPVIPQTASPGLAVALALVVSSGLTYSSFGANTILGWDANTGTSGAQDGGGTWDAGSTANWWNGTADAVWPNALGATTTAVIGTNNGTAGTITISGTVTVNTLLFNPAASGSYTLSGGTLSLAGTSPTIKIGASGLAVTINSVLADGAGASSITFSDGNTTRGTITLSGLNTYTGSSTLAAAKMSFNTLANGGVASSFGAGGNTVAVVVGNSGSYAQATYTGSGGSTDRPWTVNGVATGNTINNNGTGPISFNNTGPVMSGTGGRYLTLGGSYTGGANTFAEQFTDLSGGTTALTINGSGTWNITGANTHSGGTTLTAGVLNLGNASALGSGTFTIAGNSSFDNTTGNDLTVANAFTLSGGNPTYVGSSGRNMTINGPVTLSGANRTITVSGGTLTLGGPISGAYALTKAGSGTLALFGVNAFTGGMSIGSTGTLLINNDAALGSASGGLAFSSSGVLAASNNGASVNSPVVVGAARSITVSSGVTAGFSTQDTNSLVVAAKITGPGNVTKKSSSYALGTVRFSNDANDYTGDFSAGYGNTEFTSIADQGTPSSLGAGAVGTRGQITLNTGGSSGTLRYVGAGASATHRPLSWTGTASSYALDASGSGSVQFLATDNVRSGSGGVVTLSLRGTNTGPNTLAQVVADLNGATSLSKLDAGTWVLTGNNTYSGNTTVSGGTLFINGSLAGASAVAVQTNATLGGSGVIAGVVTVNAGGTLAPGASADALGTLTLQASPVLNGVLAMNLNKSGSTLASDQLALGANDITFGGSLVVTASGDALAANDAFSLVTSAGAFRGGFSSVSLPALAGGLAWDTNKLATTGLLDIYNFTTKTVSFSTPKDTQTVVPGVKLAGFASSTRGAAVALSATAPAHGTASVASGSLTYTPAPGFSGTDTFALVYGDGHGCQTAAVTVNVGSGTGVSSNIVSGPLVTNGNFVIGFAGIPGYTYTVETNAAPSGTGWSKLGNYTVPAAGTFEVTQPVGGASSLFFRTVWPSY